MLRVEKLAGEDRSEQRLFEWVIRHSDWIGGRGLQPVHLTGVFQNIDDLGKLRGGMLCNAGYVHGGTSR
jgi:hypothetical protein